MGWNPLDALGDAVNEAAEIIEPAWESATEAVGEFADDALDVLADGAELVGLDGAAEALDDFGDQVSSALGGEIEERQLGETRDPKELIRGEPEVIGDTAETLGTMAGAVEQTGDGLRSIDAGDWTGEGREGFDAAFDPQPRLWFDAADAFTDAGTALGDWGFAVESAQQRAAEAIAEWDAALAEERRQKDWWNGLPADTRANTPLVDTWSGRYRAALDILRRARTDRDAAAERAGTAIGAAMEQAPTEPPFTSRMAADVEDGLAIADFAALSFTDGLLTGLTGIVQFVRQINPTDVYNLTHPADYLTNMSTMATGLVVVAADPASALDAILTEARTNPFEFTGALTSEVLLTAATGGAGAGRLPLSLANRLRHALPDGPSPRGGVPDPPRSRSGFGDRPGGERPGMSERPGSSERPPSSDLPASSDRPGDSAPPPSTDRPAASDRPVSAAPESPAGSGAPADSPPRDRAGAPESARPDSPMDAAPADRPGPEPQDRADFPTTHADPGPPPDRTPETATPSPDPQPDSPATQQAPDRTEPAETTTSPATGSTPDPPDPRRDTYTPPEYAPSDANTPPTRPETDPASDPRSDSGPAGHPGTDTTAQPSPARADSADAGHSPSPANSPAPDSVSRPETNGAGPDTATPPRAEPGTDASPGTGPDSGSSPNIEPGTHSSPGTGPSTGDTAARPAPDADGSDPERSDTGDPAPTRPDGATAARPDPGTTPADPATSQDSGARPTDSAPIAATSHAPGTTPNATTPNSNAPAPAPRPDTPQQSPLDRRPDHPQQSPLDRRPDPATARPAPERSPAPRASADPGSTPRRSDLAAEPHRPDTRPPVRDTDPSGRDPASDPPRPTPDTDAPRGADADTDAPRRPGDDPGRPPPRDPAPRNDERPGPARDSDSRENRPDDDHRDPDSGRPPDRHDSRHPDDDTRPADRDPDAPERPRPDDDHRPRDHDDSTTPRDPDDAPNDPSPEDRAAADAGLGDTARSGDPANDRTPSETTACGDPVDMATGEFLLPQTDLDLPGVLPLTLHRRHRSNYRWGRWFGPSWSATLDLRLVTDDGGVTFVAEDGRLLAFPHAEPGTPVRPRSGSSRWTCVRGETGAYRVHDPDREITWHFAPEPGANGRDVRLGDYAISAITDRHRNRVRFHYDADGAPVEISHSGGYRVRVRTARGRVTSLAVLPRDDEPSPPAVVREFAYDNGELTAVTNAVGATTRFTYDDAGRMLTWTDSRGTGLRNSYDDRGRVTAQHGTHGIRSATFAYREYPDGTGTLSTRTDSLGATTVFGFDADLRLRDLRDPTGARTRIDYNADRRPLAVTAPDGAVTRYFYTAEGDPVRVVRPDGRSIDLVYAARNRPIRVTEPDGAVRHQEWDAAGNLAATIAPGGARTEWTHHPNGAPASMTAADGGHTRLETDAAGLPTVVTDPLGGVTRIRRDRFGRPAEITDPLGRTTRYTWSAEGTPLTRTDPDGGTESWQHDGEGRPIRRVDRAGGITAFDHGSWDLLTARTAPDGTLTRYGYDTEGRLLAVAGPTGATWHYAYDPAGRMIAETDFNGATTRYTHTESGRVATVTPPTGDVRRHRYDILGRLTEVTADSGAWRRFRYDDAGRLLAAVSGHGDEPIHELTFTHTAAGEVLSETLDGASGIRYEHDAVGRRVRRTDPGGAQTRWAFDPAGRPLSLGFEDRHIGFTHDAAGQLTGWTVGDLAVTRAFDPAGRLTAQSVVAHPPSLLDLGGARPAPRDIRTDSYTWRADDYPLTHVVRGPDQELRRAFDLDPAGRVTTVRENATVTERYHYDALANITAAGLTGGADRREYRGTLLVRDGRTRYHHDAAGRLVRTVRTRLSRAPEIWEYRYDGFDQLTDVRTPDGQWWHYTYDALGRRTGKQRRADDGTVPEHTRYRWDGAQLVSATTEATGTTGTATIRWHYHPGTPTPLTQTIDRDAVDREFYAVVTDLVGTPTELVDPAAARTAATAHTDLWGRTTWHGTATTPLRFPGQLHDPETGLHYNLHRVYDPATGRYLTPDPLGLAPAPNPHAYPHNPLAWSDPLGLAPAACDPRNQPGTATGGENLRHIQPGEQWLRGSEGNAGRIPAQVADVLRGQRFDTFRDFREAFWRAVHDVPHLREQFSPGNQTLMSNGQTPFAARAQRIGGAGRYNLHHIDPIHNGGGVYDLDNLVVVTPLYHKYILDPDFHYDR